MTTGDWLALGGDLLVTISLVVTLFVFLAQKASDAESLRQSALAVLEGAREGIDEWAGRHFGIDYSGEKGDHRAANDYDMVIGRNYQQYFPVPPEPLVNIIEQPDEGRYIAVATIKAVNVALWRVSHFNMAVNQNANFVARHASEILGDSTSPEQREAIAWRARSISKGIFKGAIGDGKWYSDLIAALDMNIKALEALGRRRWWQLRPPTFPDLLATPSTG